MNDDLAMLVGFLLSDGSVYYDKSKQTYCIQLTNTVPALLERFKSLMRACFHLENYSINNCPPAKSVRFFSKKSALELFEYSPSYRTARFPDGSYPPSKIPEAVFANNALLKNFLQAFASCDGTVVLNEGNSQFRIELGCYHLVIRRQLAEALKQFGIESTVTQTRVIVRGKKNFQLFFEEIGFLPESTVSNTRSNRFGIAKNSLAL